MATVDPNASPQTHTPATADELPPIENLPELKIYSHSNLLYWWPVWVLGYVMALLTALQGQSYSISTKNEGEQPAVVKDKEGAIKPEGKQAPNVKPEGETYLIHPSKNLGVIYTVTFVLVLLFTNVSLRGMASVVIIITAMFVTVLFAWLDWWDPILRVLPILGMHMTLGFYVVFSTVLFVVWALAFFVFDRLQYWRIRPGQMTFERVIGGGELSYDTRGMTFEKRVSDFFRNILLGLGSGDLRIKTTGARSEEIYVQNVIFVDHKVQAIQRLIAVKPDSLLETAGHD
jgi:hypothetical protein